MDQNIKLISESLEEMLTYFNTIYQDELDILRGYKTKLMEINVKLEELTNTQRVYSVGTDYKRNIFSPIAYESDESEREKNIEDEIADLKKKRDDLENKIDNESIILKAYETRIAKLKQASAASRTISKSMASEAARRVKEEERNSFITQARIDDENRSKLQREREEQAAEEDRRRHYISILKLIAFKDTYVSTVIDKRIKEEIGVNNHRLNAVKRNVPDDVRLSLDKIIRKNDEIINISEEQLRRMDYDFRDDMSLDLLIADFVVKHRMAHKGVEIEYIKSIFEKTYDFIQKKYIMCVMDIVFDNIYKHSSARKVVMETHEDDEMLFISISDNGIGIPDDYLEKSEWYSGLHRARELVYLLGGEMEVSNLMSGGTRVDISVRA